MRHPLRQPERSSRNAGAGNRDHRAGNQPAGQLRPQKEQAAGAADNQRLEHLEDARAVRQRRADRCGDHGHVVLSQKHECCTNALRHGSIARDGIGFHMTTAAPGCESPKSLAEGKITMITREKAVLGAAASMFMIVAAMPAQALTMQECSAKYKAAQTAGSLNGQKWNDFRKEQCGSDTAATPAATTTAAAPKAAEAKSASKPKSDAAAVPASAAVYPSAVDSKYSKEPAHRGRMHTCADQWKANKASNATGGLRWIQKGGGYWSECNKKLKGSA